MFPHTWAKGGVHFFGLGWFRRSNCFILIRDPNSYKTVRRSYLNRQIVYSLRLAQADCMNSYCTIRINIVWIGTKTTPCTNAYYTICITIVWIGTKTTPCTNSYYTICITIVWIRLYEFVQKPSEKNYPGGDFNRGPILRLQSLLCLPSTSPPVPVICQWFSVCRP